MSVIRLMVMDEQPVVRQGLVSFLKDIPDVRVVAAVSSGNEALRALHDLEVDVVVLDLNAGGMAGLEVIRLGRRQSPSTDFLVFSAFGEEASVFDALKAGALGFVLKTTPLQELLESIREVAQGRYCLSPSLNPAIIEFYLEHRSGESDQLASYELLSPREKQVFRLLAEGKPTREIAEILYISPKTVAKHRAAVKQKLCLENPAEMARYAIRLGIIPLPDPVAQRRARPDTLPPTL